MYLWIIRGQRASAAASQSLAANKRRRTPSGSKGGNGDGRMAAGWRQGGGRVARERVTAAEKTEPRVKFASKFVARTRKTFYCAACASLECQNFGQVVARCRPNRVVSRIERSIRKTRAAFRHPIGLSMRATNARSNGNIDSGTLNYEAIHKGRNETERVG